MSGKYFFETESSLLGTIFENVQKNFFEMVCCIQGNHEDSRCRNCPVRECLYTGYFKTDPKVNIVETDKAGTYEVILPPQWNEGKVSICYFFRSFEVPGSKLTLKRAWEERVLYDGENFFPSANGIQLYRDAKILKLQQELQEEKKEGRNKLQRMSSISDSAERVKAELKRKEEKLTATEATLTKIRTAVRIAIGALHNTSRWLKSRKIAQIRKDLEAAIFTE